METVEGLKNIEAIASVEGIDGVFIGPGDLSAALGHLGNPKHPEVLAAIEDAIRRIQACGKAAGILTGDETLAKRYVELGCLFAIDSDAHAPGQLDMKAYGCERAARLGIPADRIITTWDADRHRNWATPT